MGNNTENDSPTCTKGQMTKGIPTCGKTATYTGGSKYPGPVCETHKVDDSEPLNP